MTFKEITDIQAKI